MLVKWFYFEMSTMTKKFVHPTLSVCVSEETLKSGSAFCMGVYIRDTRTTDSLQGVKMLPDVDSQYQPVALTQCILRLSDLSTGA